MAGFRLTTKVQVSGWRFLLRRLEHALVRRDTRMFDDPISFYRRSFGTGIVISAVILLGCLALAFFKPAGKLGNGNLFIDNSTKQLYVMSSQRLHPVYNLTSARLVLGKPDTPDGVKSSEIDRMAKGKPIGIPGAPYATPVSKESSPTWALCDTVSKADSSEPSVQTSALSMPLEIGPDDRLLPQSVVITTYGGSTWVISPKGRHATDLNNRALTLALGIPINTRPAPLSEAMFNAIPDAGPWELPPIPNAGAPNSLGLPPELVIGSVFQLETSMGKQFFVVLPDGVAPVNANTASLLRSIESYGLVAIPSMVKSDVTRIPERDFPSPLPDEPIKVVSRSEDPVLCWTWQRVPGEQAPRTTMLATARLPIPASEMNRGVDQIQGSVMVYLDGGRYVQIQSPDPRYGESLYYVDPQGVRYGVPNPQTAGAMGLNNPTAAPWGIIRLLVDGPVLSKEAALLEHDTLPPDPNPRRIPPVAEGAG